MILWRASQQIKLGGIIYTLVSISCDTKGYVGTDMYDNSNGGREVVMVVIV